MKRLRQLVREMDPEPAPAPTGGQTETPELDTDEILDRVAEYAFDVRITVAEEVDRLHAHSRFDEEAGAGSSAAAPAAPPKERKQTWIELQFLDDRTGKPVNNLRIVLKPPDGNETFRTTDANGLIRADPIDPGTCDARSDLKGAKMADTLKYVGDGTPPAPPPSETEPEPLNAASVWHIADVEYHKVKKGETLDGLAKKAEMTWQDLAKFNWDTAVPDEINKHLRDDVGCTKKTANGFNYVFDDSDKPGIVLIPNKWKREKLATGSRYIYRVRPMTRFLVILENDYEQRIPEADYEATLADGSVRTGKLGIGGTDVIEDPPKGDVWVVFPDVDDIEAKSLAAAVRKAFDKRDPMEVHRLFRYPRESIDRAMKAYDKYYNDLHGQGLRHDIEQEYSSDPDADIVFFGHLNGADMTSEDDEGSEATHG